ncbi:MAG: YecA family protein [Thiohalomonadaceae bacterium]
MKTGRNDPCPCGSGKKYKQCCLQADQQSFNPAREINEELRQLLEGKQLDSLEAMQAEAERFFQARNHAPLSEFHGLSPMQMQQMLDRPFDSPELVRFSVNLDIKPDAPVARLFSLLADGIGEQGVKPTAKGNLPRALCREVVLAYLGEEGYAKATRYSGINKEEDFFELHQLRLVAEMAGLLRKYRGKFVLSRECKALLAGPGMAAIYPRLLHTFVTEYNWAYGDGHEELPFIQRSFLFTLYLLWRYGDEPRPVHFYEEAYIDAFPALLTEIKPSAYFEPEDILARCYSLRTISRFAEWFGLVEVEKAADPRVHFSDLSLRKTGLFEQVVNWV